uniref:CYP109C2 n=1 Tax=Sorangium cellulosum TaxID=56 RepID=A0A7M4BCY4_SORCE|nr:CYP109C2 [Sorangium cellulosum]
MIDFTTEEMRRNPFPVYEMVRNLAPLLNEPRSGLWLVFDYEGVKRVLNDHAVFSAQHGPAEWIVFMDPPRHTKLRALISQAFLPRHIAGLEPRIRELSRQLLDQTIEQGEMDLAADFAVPLPMMVIAEMLGIPAVDRPLFKRWSDVILNMSYAVAGSSEAAQAASNFMAVTAEMNTYLTEVLEQRRAQPKDDLLTRLLAAEVDGDRLTQKEILNFFQALLVAGQETTTNLINNAIICFIENPDQLARLRARPDLLPAAIEEVLRYRSPVQWMFRVTKQDVEMHGQVIPAGKLVLAMIGAANRDPGHFQEADRFDIAREPNPHIAFGHGIHFCLGAALSRLEARIALADLLARVKDISFASDTPWQPRKALHVHGPERLPIRFRPV